MSPSKDNPILVSVVVPTFNRAELVRDLVESLRRQTLPPVCFEALVIDNCSTDHTADLIAQLRMSVPFHLVYHRMPENLGPVLSRNLGAGMAHGEVLAFTDSDCRVSPDWLESALAVFERHPETAFVTGPVKDKPEQPGGFFTLRYDALPGEDPTYRACNVFYRAAIFWKAGGFDQGAYYGQTSFMHYECADIDLAWRLKEKGYANVYAPDVIVYHEVWKVTPWNWLHKQTQLMPLPFFLKRHPQVAKSFLWRGRLYAPQNALFYLLAVGVILSPAKPWLLVLALPYVVWLVNRVTSELWRRPVRLVAALTFWGLAQAVMCGSLLWGSIRARKIVL